MLKGIDPILGPELLAMLRAMGHGDEIVIADANFPAAANARRLVRMEGVPAPRVVQAIVSLLPLDEAVPNAAFNMAMSDAPDQTPAVVREFAQVLAKAGYARSIEPIERHAFYARAREAFGIVATGEPRFWGNLILKKGAIPPEGGA
ncbi:MAG TPA: RbsD/FucU domain-containing protein [Caulobacteraceae bacterium]|nr:RbsD/FucU domain-containing protein [Caulobacteraceae bacterium]